MKIQKTTEPRKPNPLPSEGLEGTIMADCHVHIQYAGGCWGWRVLVDMPGEPRYLMEGTTHVDLGDAMQGLMWRIQHPAGKARQPELPMPKRALPEPRKEIEG